MTEFKGGDWEQWAYHVFAELKRFDNDINSLKNKDMETIKDDIQKIKLDVATMKTKLAIWGSLAVFIATIITQIILSFIKQ